MNEGALQSAQGATMLGLRPMEIALIAFALILLFGATRLPALGSSLGSAIRNFKKGFSQDADEKTDEKKLSSNETAPTITSQDKAASKQG
jgi:TatA/E family protein of Tat protein translocase